MNTPGTVSSARIARSIHSSSSHAMKFPSLNPTRRTTGPVARPNARTPGLALGFTVLIERVAHLLRPLRPA